MTTTAPASKNENGPRPAGRLAVLGLLAFIAFCTLLALGWWQVERRAWKLELIARVEERVHAPPVALPDPSRWPQVTAASEEYRRVRVAGRFLHDRETLVQALSDLGSGFWVLTPLQLADGRIVLVNRGFVPVERRERASRAEGEPKGEVALIGLMRMSEPAGGFLRRNDPAANRWYSRDVAGIAAARDLSLDQVAPFFVDAGKDAQAEAAGQPVGGLTVISFRNHHMVYALTWLTLALLVLGAAWRVWLEEKRLRARGRAVQAD